MPGKKKDTTGKYGFGQASANGLHDLKLPSGGLCQAKRPGVNGMIEAGILDNFDQLTALVQTEHIGPNTPSARTKVTPAQAQALGQSFMADKEKLQAAISMMDKLVAYVVVQPPVWIDYKLTEDETDEAFAARQAEAEDEGRVGASIVDLDDKTFIMNWALGGSSDLAAFRQGTKELMAGVAPVEEIQQPA
jgi:hypothetical protein